MGLYDDGGIEFAEEQFAKSRAYKEKVAKDQEKFTQRLLGIDTLVKGANALINANAKKADANNLWQRGNYESLVSQSTDIRNQDKLNKSSNISSLKYLENNFYTQILDEATKDYSQADIDKLKPAFRQYANQLAQGGLDEYEAMLENAYNIPSFGENAEDFEAWYEQNSETPRNLVEWSGQKVKKIFKINNKETLEHEADKAIKYNPSAGAFKSFGALEESIKSYHAVTDEGFKLAEIIEQAKKDGLYLGKVVKINNPTSEDVFDYKKGTKTSVTTQSVLRENVNNIEDEQGKVPAYILDVYNVSKNVSQIKENMLTFKNIQDIKSLAKPGSNLAKQLDVILKNNPTFADGSLAYEEINNNPSDLNIDWQDEESFNRAFDDWYSGLIQFELHPSKDKKNVYLGRWDNDAKRYTENPNYMNVIKEQGLDRETQKKRFKEYGSTAGFRGSNFMGGEDSETYTPLTNLIKKTPSLEEAFKRSLQPEGLAMSSNGFDLMSKTQEAINNEEDFVNLGQQDLGIVFQIPELEGTIINLYYDILNQAYVQKGK